MIGEAIIAIGLILPLLFIVAWSAAVAFGWCSNTKRGPLSTGPCDRHGEPGLSWIIPMGSIG